VPVSFGTVQVIAPAPAAAPQAASSGGSPGAQPQQPPLDARDLAPLLRALHDRARRVRAH